MDKRPDHADLDAWLDALRRGPDVPLPERLETPPVAARTRWKPIAVRATLVAAALVLCTVAAIKLGPNDRTKDGQRIRDRVTDHRPAQPVSAFRRLTRARTLHLEGWSTTIRHDNEGTQIAGHRLVALGE